MLLSNPFRPDPRVAKEARGLCCAGHRVTIVCWDRESQFAAQEEKDGLRIERIQGTRSHYGAGARQLLYIPRFWNAAYRRTVALDPDIVHCHDLDTLPAGWWIKRRTGCRLVYDSHEDYPAMMSLYLPRPMVLALSWLERFLVRSVDQTITASTVLADKFAGRGLDRVTTLGNFHHLDAYDRISSTDIARKREALGVSPDDLVVTYIGGFSRNRLLLPLIEATVGMRGVRVFVWGDGHQREAVEAVTAASSNAHYGGWLASEQVPLHTRMSDVIYYGLREDYPGAVYNAPNTLGHAMAAGRPMIANDVGDLGRIVRQTGCGVLIRSVTPPDIRHAVEMLRDPDLRAQMGTAGRRAAEATYNQAYVDELLLEIYRRLEKSN